MVLGCTLISFFHHFRSEKGTGAEIRPAIVSGIVTDDAAVVTIPEVFAKVNSVQFPSHS